MENVAEEFRAEMISDPSARYFLKALVTNYEERDPVDMVQDLEIALRYYKLKLKDMGIPLTGADLIAKERHRQIIVEGWTDEHDKQHTEGELSLVAALYATPIPLYEKQKNGDGISFKDPWPWWDTIDITRYPNAGTTQVPAWDKRKKHPRLKCLIIAGALIAAEIDRLQREQSSKDPCPHGMSMCGDCGEQCSVRGKYKENAGESRE